MAPHTSIFKTMLYCFLTTILILTSCAKDGDLFYEYVDEQISEEPDDQGGEIGEGINAIYFEIRDDIYNISAGQNSAILNVLENDSLPESQLQGFKIIKTSEPKEGTLTINQDNTLSYEPSGNLAGRTIDELITDVFTYTVEVVANGETMKKEAEVVVNTQYFGEVKAFPDAQGFGKYTTGGRGGAVYHVTNLNNNGYGSLRDAVSESNRFIIFDIAGTINITEDLNITGSNLTIAGESAPGDGISVFGDETVVTGQNIIIRHIRFRNGRKDSSEDSFRIQSQFHSGTWSNYMIDHCSFSWGNDEVVAIETGDDGNVLVQDVTFQNCIFSESFNGKNVVLYGGNQVNISFLKNYFANTSSRNMRSNQGSNGKAGNKPKQFEFIDNYTYNYNTGLGPEFGAEFNAIGNVYEDGPSEQLYGATIALNGPHQCNECELSRTKAFISDNIWNGGEAAISSLYQPYLTTSSVISSGYQSMGSSQVVSHVRNNVGARVGLENGRDDLDTEMINDGINNTGRFVSNISQTSGLPELSIERRASNYDTDRDGMADEWEIRTFGTLNQTAQGDENDNGYTNIEEFLFSIVAN